MGGLSLGAFELHERVGEGGMAEVWAGIHTKERVPVAVKVVTEPDLRRPQLYAALRTEVRAMARLDHHRVVMVFDHGEITPEVEQGSGGKLLAGSPYLVMELATGGTALTQCGRVSWRRVRGILTSLLDALGHAHARGVLHRDVKPSNVLVFDDGVKLSDFGLALDLEPGANVPRRRGRVLGTPAYMAPEQFVCDVREYGPATDLYALGCLAYALVAGGPPYGRGHDLTLMYELHLEAVIPPLESRIPVPKGFEDWLDKLLQKKPSRRYQRAADAQQALIELGDPPNGNVAPLIDDMGTVDALSSSVVTVCAELSDGPLTARPASDPRESIPPPAQPPPFPKSWRREEPPRREMGLLGAGLGLYGVRPVPLVARETERDRLWELLRATSEKREKHLILLEGPAGCGKTRMAEWLCERAHEAGVADVLRAVHSERAGPGHGLAPMVASYLQCEGLERPALTDHVHRRLGRLDVRDDADVEALAELVKPDSEDSIDRSVRFASTTERYVVVARLLRRMSRFRPVIVWLEDVQWSHDAIAFAQHMLFLEKSDNFPVLLLMTARSEVLAEMPERGRQLAACGAHRGATAMRMAPLPEDDWPKLVERLLRLEPALAARIAARTKGNPLFAVQLVGHWIDRGLLEAGPDGFALVSHAEVELPEELHTMWLERIDGLLAERPSSDPIALELAAMLGAVVDGAEWREVCAVAGRRPSDGLVEALIGRRLAVGGERGADVSWSFVHGMLRESLERRAVEAGRASAHHQTCAHMLRQRSGPEVAERLARHLTEAGELRMALEPLRDAASQRLATGDYALADALLSEREQALVTLESDEADVSWIEGWLLRGELAAKRGSFDVGLKWATLAADAAREHGHEALHARGLLLRGKLERMRGDAGRAEPDLERAEALARGLDDDRLLAEVLESLGRVSMHKGALERAEGCLVESLQLWRRARDRRGAAETTWALAHLMTYRKRYDEAFDYNHEALEVIRSSGDRWSTARCLNTAGEIARVRGLLEDAEHYYRKAGEMMATIGANDSALVCECNVARVLAERGEYGQARVTLSRAVAAFERQERKNPLSWVYCVLLVCDAGERDWSAWAHHLGRALEVLQDTSYLDLDIATVAELAGNLARDAGEPKHAAAAYQLSAKQWRGLERNEDGARVEMALRQLRPKEA